MADKFDELKEAREKFLEAGYAYWKIMQKCNPGGAVCWLTDANDGMVVFTREEYREQMLLNIERLGPTYHFGGSRADGL